MYIVVVVELVAICQKAIIEKQYRIEYKYVLRTLLASWRCTNMKNAYFFLRISDQKINFNDAFRHSEKHFK